MADRLKNLSNKFVAESNSYFDYLTLLPKKDKQIIDRVN